MTLRFQVRLLTFDSTPANGSKVVAKITNTVDFEDDIAIEGGSSEGSYVTKKITLENHQLKL